MLACSMTDNNSSPSNTPSSSHVPEKRLRRATRYQKAQDRRQKQAASDGKFYAAMFSLMSVLALLVVLVGALMLGGGSVNVSGMAGLATPWLGPFTILEVIGVAFVAIIAATLYFRMRKR